MARPGPPTARLAYYDILLANTSTGAATVAVTGNAASLMNGSGGIHLEGVQNFNVANVTGNAAADLTVSHGTGGSRLFGTPATGGIAKSGAGTMLLTNTNTYTGDTTVAAGVLAIDTGGSLTASSLIKVTGGELKFNSSSPPAVWTCQPRCTLSGAGAGRLGNVTYSAASGTTYLEARQQHRYAQGERLDPEWDNNLDFRDCQGWGGPYEPPGQRLGS